MGYIKKTDRNKAWAKKTTYKRSEIIIKSIKNIFLIYCEGSNTEPVYFKSFPVDSETQVEVVGVGRSRTSLVEHIIDLAKEKELLKGQKHYDEDRQIWCVFDKDSKGIEGEDEDFNNSIKLARDNGLRVAYSNDSFELWLILHDKYLDVQQTRKEYYDYLSEKFGIKYEEIGKTKEFAKSLYQIYLRTQPSAIRSAKKLHDTYFHEPSSSKHFPCTTVYLLI